MIKRTINRLRLFRNKKKESYSVFYKLLGFYPGNINLYEEALLHKSSSREIENGRYQNNERLEFLGDAILDAIIADLVFHQFKNKKEGFLTNMRSKIVQRETLDRVATELGLHKIIVSSPKIFTSTKNHILGNALEALIGAVYLDKGYVATKKFVEEKIIRKYINMDSLAKKEVNFKSKLLEWSQKYKVDMEFDLLENFTDDKNNPVFQMQVTLNGLLAGIGIGFSKKEAQQQAAQMAIDKLRADKNFFGQINEQKEEKSEEDTPVVQEEPTPEDQEQEITT